MATARRKAVQGSQRRGALPKAAPIPVAAEPRPALPSAARASLSAAARGQFRPIQGTTLSSRIVAQVRGALFSGAVRSGDPIGSENELAEQFGVSRMSVRDALRMLEAMGIVEIRLGAGGGARVAQPSLDRFSDSLAIQLALIGVSPEEVLQAQGAIEHLTAELAASNATVEDLQTLRELLDEAGRNLDDPRATTELGRAFHMAVARASHNRVLEAQLNALRESLWRPGTKPPTRTVAKRVLATHEAIFRAIEAGDRETAGRLMSEHLHYLLEKETPAGSARARKPVESHDEFCAEGPVRSPAAR